MSLSTEKPYLDFTGLVPGALSVDAFTALPLRQQAIYVAEQRVKSGLPPYNWQQHEVQPSHASGEGMTFVPHEGNDWLEPTPLLDWVDIVATAIYRTVAAHFTPDIYRPAWQQYVTHSTLPDFRWALGRLPDPVQRAHVAGVGDPAPDDTLIDRGYRLQIKRWARLIALPWISIENDDKGFLALLPTKMIGAIERSAAKHVVRGFLEWPDTGAGVTQPPAYDDGPFFYGGTRWSSWGAGRAYAANLLTGDGARCSQDALIAAGYKMAALAGDEEMNRSLQPQGVHPAFLVVPTALEGVGREALDAVRDEDHRCASLFAACDLIVEPTLTDPDTWYLLPPRRYSPIHVVTRDAGDGVPAFGTAGLRVRMWRDVQQQFPLMGGAPEDDLLPVGDVRLGVSFDFGANAACPWYALKFAPGRPPGAPALPAGPDATDGFSEAR